MAFRVCVCVCVCVCPNLIFIQFMFSHFSHVPLFVTLWTTAHQVPLSMGFSRQENWSGLPYSPPGDLPDPGIKRPPALRQVLYHLSYQAGAKR